jgi:DNA-binding transcriptional regulator YhcF (GntR family)
MARKKVPRTLPALPGKRRLQRAQHKTEELTEILREAAMRNRRKQPRAFYSMRQVSSHFGVPFSVVSRVYDRLGHEGLLTAVRGSKTLLQSQRFDRQLSVRAFVGLPASLSAFVTVQAYRMFFIKIRRELRVRGFATAMLFFEDSEARTAVLSEILKTYEVDTVLWFQPPKVARETTARLKDRGVRVIGIAHEQFPNILCRYQVRRDRAIGALLTEWKSNQGIDHVTIAQWPDQPAPLSEEALRSAVDETGLNISIVRFRGQRSEAFIRSLKKVKTGAIAFSSGQLASQLCFRAPVAVADLLRSRRVAFLNGPVSMPFAKIPNVEVDLVVVDWQWVAEQITSDLINQDAFHAGGISTFEAEPKLRVPLRDFAQPI